MRIREKMSPRIELVPYDESATIAAACMQRADVGCLAVVEGDRLLGIVTDRDIVCRAVASGRDPRTVLVRDIMTRGCTTVSEDASPAECAGVMQAAQVRRVVVVDKDQRPIGIVSTGDLAQLDPAATGTALAVIATGDSSTDDGTGAS